jgi:hypothetical protein
MVAELIVEHVYQLADPHQCSCIDVCESNQVCKRSAWRGPIEDGSSASPYFILMRHWYAEGDEMIAHAQIVGHLELWVLLVTLADADRAREQLLSAPPEPDPDESPPLPEPIGSTVLTHAPPARPAQGAPSSCLSDRVVTAAA